LTKHTLKVQDNKESKTRTRPQTKREHADVGKKMTTKATTTQKNTQHPHEEIFCGIKGPFSTNNKRCN